MPLNINFEGEIAELLNLKAMGTTCIKSPQAEMAFRERGQVKQFPDLVQG